tara:strand:- start:7690 stop:7968 length:279 start_codon:yes stop_codon:yes gene_type:complete
MKKNWWDIIMDDRVNAIKTLPFQVKFMSMQILAWLWSAVFGIYIVESIYAFGISAAAHALLITATVLTAIYFREVQKERISSALRGKGGEHE